MVFKTAHAFIYFLILMSLGCSSIYNDRMGVLNNEDLLAPANISVVSCLVWPRDHEFEKIPNAVLDNEESKKACKSFDEFIIASFSGQPFMKGKTPRLVQKELAASGKSQLIASLNDILVSSPPCKKCKGVQAFYENSLSGNPDFMKWVEEFKKAVPSSDSLLIPVISGHSEWTDDDRALPRKQRKAKASLLLIRTSNRTTQWFGARVGYRAKVFSPSEPQIAPDWSLVYEQIFIDSLWKDFPGRQYFRE